MPALITDIWVSFRALPDWVQIWVAGILVPVNCISIAFWGAPFGAAIAILAVGGMVPNAILMVAERGLSKAMALSHLVFWLPLVVLVSALLIGDIELAQVHRTFLIGLLVIDLASLAFDLPDAVKWFQGDRDVAGN